MRPILAALLTAAVAVPSTAFACGMPMRVAEVQTATLADALDAIAEADEAVPDKPTKVDAPATKDDAKAPKTSAEAEKPAPAKS